MNYIVIKQPKSKGIAILLVAFLGPIGMFYSTIAGGLTMTLGAPAILFSLLWKGWASHSSGIVAIAIFWAFLAYILCFFWAISAIEDYNSKIETEAYSHTNVPAPTETKESIYENLERINKLNSEGILPDEIYQQQKDEYLYKLNTFDQTQASSDYQLEFEKAFGRDKASNPYKVWIIIILAIGLITSWWIYNNLNNTNKENSEINGKENSENKESTLDKPLNDFKTTKPDNDAFSSEKPTQLFMTGYQYLLSTNNFISFKYSRTFSTSGDTFITKYKIYHPTKGTYILTITATHYKNEKKVEVVIEDTNGGIFSEINKEETAYETPTLDVFGFRGSVGALGGEKVPNQLAVKFTSARFENVKVASVLGSHENNDFEFFVLDQQ